MADIFEELVAQELLNEAKSNTALEVGGLFDSLGSTALQMIQQDAALPSSERRYSMGDAIGAGLISGLLGGGFGAVGRNIRDEDFGNISSVLSGKSIAEDALSPSLYKKATTYRDLLSDRRDREAEAEQKKLIQGIGADILKDRIEKSISDRREESEFLGGLNPQIDEKAKMGGSEQALQPQQPASLIPKIARQVPPAMREAAVKESGTYKALQFAFQKADEAFDLATKNVTAGQRVDAVLPFGMRLPSVSDEAQNYDAAVASLIGSLAPSVKGPLSDSDLVVQILPYMPTPMDTEETRANKRQLLKNFLATNAEATPILEEYGVVPNRQEISTTQRPQPGAPAAPQGTQQYTPSQLLEMGYVKVPGGWAKDNTRTAQGNFRG